jgi:hypothetical protein
MGGADRGVPAALPGRLIRVRTLAGVCYRRFRELAGFGGLLLEHLRGRARIGGQPVEVLFREGFGRVSGGEDYPDYAVFIEDGNRKRVRKAGVGTSLREAPRARHGQGGVGGFHGEVYHAPVRGRKVLVLPEGRKVGDPDQANPISPEFSSNPLGYLLLRRVRVEGSRHGGTEY